MKKYFLIAGGIIAIVVIFVMIYLKSAQTPNIAGSEKVILFYGKECPHCQIVEDYISKNKIADKVEFSQAEVFHNQSNQKIFLEKYKTCGVTDEKEMGVPMLWADGKCLVGQDKVMEYFDKIIKQLEFNSSVLEQNE
jgi:glutaredoxin-related protein